MDSDVWVTQMDADRISDVVKVLVGSGIQVHSVQKMNPTLEQLFLRMTEGESIE